MREILFRGKTEDGKWVYGFYLGVVKFPNSIAKNCIVACELDYDYVLRTNAQKVYTVIPETVGQFTGLTDKNGTKIFEGDIVQGTIVSAWNKALIRCEVVYNKDGFISVERTRNQDWVHKVKFAKDIEVIGNIHDQSIEEF